MLERMGRFTVRRRRWIVPLSLVAMALAGTFGAGVTERLTAGGFDSPSSESYRAREYLEQHFHAGEPNFALVLSAPNGSVDAPAAARTGANLSARLAREKGVSYLVSYFTPGAPTSLRSDDGSKALVLARLGGSDDRVQERSGDLAAEYGGSHGALAAKVGGAGIVYRDMTEQIESDLAKAETITFPFLLVALVIVFGSALAAGLPLAVGALSVLGTMLVLTLVTYFADVSIYALNLTTMLGLGVGIDYSLFVIARFREELRADGDAHEAAVRTVTTAGRTVLFSALTVAASLGALLVFPMAFLRSFAYAGIPVVLIAAAGALVPLPALLAVLGKGIDRWALLRRRPAETGQSVWAAVARFVMHRPLPVAAAVIAVLVIVAAPFFSIRFGQVDHRALPPSSSARTVQEEIRTSFSSQEASSLQIVARDASAGAEQRAIEHYAERLSNGDNVARVDSPVGSYVDGRRVAGPPPPAARFAVDGATRLSVVPAIDPMGESAERLTDEVRAVPAPFPVEVGGGPAAYADSKDILFGRLPLALGLIAATTCVLLFLMTGSVLMPLKAVILNLLSLSATFGAMVWIFQEGHGAELLGFTPTGFIDTTNPILMFCIAFGLSMDYEVFLLSRIKEQYDRTGDNMEAVATGLEQTGRIITAAALLMAIVFLAFSTSQVTVIKLIGIGLALAVLLDATLIRGFLVPAFMRLMGDANWWAPRPLKRVHERFGIREAAPHARERVAMRDVAT